MNMQYDKNGLPVREYYTEELKKSFEDKMKVLRYQKHYTGCNHFNVSSSYKHVSNSELSF